MRLSTNSLLLVVYVVPVPIPSTRSEGKTFLLYYQLFSVHHEVLHGDKSPLCGIFY